MLHRKILFAVSILKSLAKSKLDRIKKKLNRYVINQKDVHTKFLEISNEHKYAIFDFYLEYYKNNYSSVKDNSSLEEMMFFMSKSILKDEDIPSKDLKNVIDFCTFILKNSENEERLKKITDCSRSNDILNFE